MRWGMLFVVALGCASSEPVEQAVVEVDGETLFLDTCAVCHGDDGRGGDFGPDLADRARDLAVEDIEDVILDGSGFMDPVDVSYEEARAIAAYVESAVLGR